MAHTPKQAGVWIAHDGGPCPVAPDTLVVVRKRSGATFAAVRAIEWGDDEPELDCWLAASPPDVADIVAYRIVPTTTGEA